LPDFHSTPPSACGRHLPQGRGAGGCWIESTFHPNLPLGLRVRNRPIADIRRVCNIPLMRSARTISILLFVPPILFLVLSHTVSNTAEWYWAAVIAVVLAGFAGIATSGWSIAAKAIVGALYATVAVATPLLAFLALVAVCTTGNCI
jgi:hypothetical protein